MEERGVQTEMEEEFQPRSIDHRVTTVKLGFIIRNLRTWSSIMPETSTRVTSYQFSHPELCLTERQLYAEYEEKSTPKAFFIATWNADMLTEGLVKTLPTKIRRQSCSLAEEGRSSQTSSSYSEHSWPRRLHREAILEIGYMQSWKNQKWRDNKEKLQNENKVRTGSIGRRCACRRVKEERIQLR